MATYFLPQKRPKVLLINFSTDDQKLLTDKGYNSELGFVGRPYWSHGARYWDYYFESPPYEYDIIVYDSDITSAKRPLRSRVCDRCENPDDFRELTRAAGRGFALAFVGPRKEECDNLSSGGLPLVRLTEADARERSLSVIKPVDLDIEEIHTLISKHKGAIPKVGQYVTVDSRSIVHSPLIVNRRGDWVGFYCVGMRGASPSLEYLVLPQFEQNIEVVTDVLNLLMDLRPDLFPGRTRLDWLKDEEFVPQEVKAIEEEVRQEEGKLEDSKRRKERQKKAIAKRLGYFVQILLADDEHFKGDERLKPNVQEVLDFLGFAVVDRDLQIKRGKKKEDLIITDGDWSALVEVRGTRKQNPPEHFYSDLLKHLVKAKGTGPSRGLLIVNYDIARHPFRRTPIYKDSPDLLKDNNGVVGVLSTVELHRIAMAVRRGQMTKKEARSRIKEIGRIMFAPQ